MSTVPLPVLVIFVVLFAGAGSTLVFGRKRIAKNMPADKANGVWGLSPTPLLWTGILLFAGSLLLIGTLITRVLSGK